MSLPKNRRRMKEKLFVKKTWAQILTGKTHECFAMLDFKPRWDLGMDLEERFVGARTQAWGQDSSAVTFSGGTRSLQKLCVLTASSLSIWLHPSLPPAHRALCLYWSGSRASKARCGM